jgi:hypothetical protein
MRLAKQHTPLVRLERRPIDPAHADHAFILPTQNLETKEGRRLFYQTAALLMLCGDGASIARRNPDT